MVKNEISFLFNTERLILGLDLPEITDQLENIKLSSPELIVYSNDSLKVVISNVGLVSITTPIDINTEFKKSLSRIMNEYDKLTNLNKMFSHGSKFKIVTPKVLTKKVTEQLQDLEYMVNVADTYDSDTISVIH